MTEVEANIGHSEAQSMLDAFASVGATEFDVTWTTRSGEKEWFRRGMSLANIVRAMPAMLDSALGKQRNIIVRPHGYGTAFIQLDDVAPTMLTRLTPAVFLALQTSPGNFQAWLAMTGTEDKDFTRRLRKGTEADINASGATRVAGSLNFKERYAPNFPRIAIHRVNPGRITTPAELRALGLVAAAEAPAPPRFRASKMRPRPGNRKWPDYARCVEGAPLNGDKSGPDISRADFVWCMTAITWGWNVDETASRLVGVSGKARENGEGYAVRTALNAAAAVERGRAAPLQKPFGTLEKR